jgi:hypothetical protein
VLDGIRSSGHHLCVLRGRTGDYVSLSVMLCVSCLLLLGCGGSKGSATNASCSTSSTTTSPTAANVGKIRALEQLNDRLHQNDRQLITKLRAAETLQSPDLMQTLIADQRAVLRQINDVEQRISRLEATSPGTTVPCAKK